MVDINTVIDPILQIRKLKVTDLIFLNPKVLHLTVGHATYIPLSGSILESLVEWYCYCFWSSVQKGTWNCSSIVFHTLVPERFGKLRNDQLIKWLLIGKLLYRKSGQNFHESIWSSCPLPSCIRRKVIFAVCHRHWLWTIDCFKTERKTHLRFTGITIAKAWKDYSYQMITV